jgi:hypothetical protein
MPSVLAIFEDSVADKEGPGEMRDAGAKLSPGPPVSTDAHRANAHQDGANAN